MRSQAKPRTKPQQRSLSTLTTKSRSVPSSRSSSQTPKARIATASVIAHTFPLTTTSRSVSMVTNPHSTTTISTTPVDLTQQFDISHTVRRSQVGTRHYHHQQQQQQQKEQQQPQQQQSFSTRRFALTNDNANNNPTLKSIHHQSKRSIVINPPKDYYESPYGTPLDGSEVSTFVGLYSKAYKSFVAPQQIIDATKSDIPTENVQAVKNTLVANNNKPRELSSIDPTQLKGKRVFVRADLNVVYEPDPDTPGESRVTETSKNLLLEALPTLQYLIDVGSQIVLAGNKNTTTSLDNTKSLVPVAKALTTLLQKKVIFVQEPLDNEGATFKSISNDKSISSNDILLLDNLATQNDIQDESFAQRVLDIIDPSLCIYDSFDAITMDDSTVQKLPTLARQSGKKIGSVVGLKVAKELAEVQQLIQELEAIDSTVTKTLLLGGDSFNDLIPAIAHSFHNTQNFIFANKASFALSHITHLTETTLNGGGNAPALQHSVSIRPPPAYTPFLDKSAVAASMTFLASASTKNKSVWFPHDWNVVNPDSIFQPRLSLSTHQVYEPDARQLVVTDIGVSSRKDIKWAIDNVCAKQLAGHQQMIFWSGSMGNLDKDNSFGNDAIIESLNKAYDAGVVTIVGGAEVMEAIQTYSAKPKVSKPKFSLFTSSPPTAAAILSGSSVFGTLDQSQP